MSEEPVINHTEAFALACLQRDNSNLARCYIDLVRKIKKAQDIVALTIIAPAKQ